MAAGPGQEAYEYVVVWCADRIRDQLGITGPAGR